MCNIVTFQFTCQHTLRRRRSRCGGTRHKITTKSTKAACTAESFLTIYLQIECDRCQHTAWEDTWKLKLERANAFLAKLQEQDMPGVEEIAALVKDLDAEYATASWNTRTMFAHGPKPSVTRVKYSHYEKAASKLPQEVRPEDVVVKADKEWTEMDDLDYDGNYEASTDPVHPVSTDYSHPLDDDDGAWILEHLSEAGVVQTPDAINLDFENGHGWSWGEGNSDPEVQTSADAWLEEVVSPLQGTELGHAAEKSDNTLMAWGPKANAPVSKATIQLNGLTRREEQRSAKIERVIAAFWSVVNHNVPSTEPQPSTPPPSAGETSVIPLVETFNLSTTHRKPPSAPYERSPWTDGPSDLPPTSPSSTPPASAPRSTTPPSPKSTRSWYDKQRKILNQRREDDRNKYYRDWLYISRCEIRDFEGSEGNVIRGPMKAGGGGGGGKGGGKA
ncbi:hypothetical protein HBH49_192340 [Parastagonospora nodorum]|nr:hypothetical protein HBH49_192340 [Parastagonospora nodorum]